MTYIGIIFIFLFFNFCYAQPSTSASESFKLIHTNIDERSNLLNEIRSSSIKGNYSEAYKLLTQYKNKYGEDIGYLTEKARYLALNNQPQEALKLVQPLLNKDPHNQTLIDIKNYAYTHLHVDQKNNEQNELIKEIQAASIAGNYENANKLLNQYKQKYGEDTNYLTEKARFYALTNQTDKANALLKPLLEKNPNNETLLDIQKYIASKPPTTYKEVSPASSSNLLEAANASSRGQYQKALQLYKEELKSNPNNKEILLNIARIHLLKGNIKAGEKLLSEYKKKFGEDDSYLTEKARSLALNNQSGPALKLISRLLKKNPNNSTLLEIEKYARTHKEVRKKPAASLKGNLNDAKEKERRAFQKRFNSESYAKAARAYLQAGVPIRALIMIDYALSLDCHNPEYLMLKAEIAAKANKPIIAYQAYKHLYDLYPYDPKIILEFARAAGRAGKTDKSASLYKLYLHIIPNDKKAWLEYAYIQSWRGNDRMAVLVLNHYYYQFGPSDSYYIERARILAAAARFSESCLIVNALLPKFPENYDLNFARTVNFYYNHQPIEMFKSFKKVHSIKPNSEETKGLWEYIRTPYRSNIALDGYHYFDSDTIKKSYIRLLYQHFFNPLTSLLWNATAERLSASLSSGLNPIEGGHAIQLYGANIGFNHRFNPFIAVQALVGGQHTSNNENSLNYELDAFINPNDLLTLDLKAKRAFYDLSPRAVSRGVKQNLFQSTVNFKPCIQCNLYVRGAYANYTDNNAMYLIEGQPSLQLFGMEKFNLSLGVFGQYYKFHRRLSDGYYSPKDYKFGSVIANLYYKQTDNIGYEASIGIGTQRDETFTTWRPANDYSLRAYYGIFKDWYLILFGGLSTRGISIASNIPQNNTYRVYAFEATITRRF